MTRRTLALVLALVAVQTTSLVREPAARAEDVAFVGSASLEVADVLALVKQGRLREACVRTEPGRAALARPAREGEPDARLLTLGLVHAIVRAGAYLDDRKDDEAEVSRLVALAAERARPTDLPLLRALEASSKRAAPYARTVGRAACRRIDDRIEPRILVAAVRSTDGEIRRRALAAISARLARIRDKVNAGGDLDAQEQSEVSDPALVSALIDALPERAATSDALCHDTAAQACPSALHALALIESPAIPALEAARRRAVPGADAALAAVREAAVERLRRHPRSSWSSARGALPQVVPGAIACNACAKPLPESARFCPACGAAAPGFHCPRCGQVGLSEPCPRCGGLEKSAVPLCSQCGEQLSPEHAFCKRCGAKREGTLPPPPSEVAREAPPTAPSVEKPAAGPPR